jgi:integrase
LTIQYINRILNYYASITCHDLRRYFAVNNRLAGVSADLIQNALMHRNPATTYTYIENALTVRRLYGDKYISDYLQRNRKGVYIMKEAA